MSLRQKIPALADRVIRGHTEFRDHEMPDLANDIGRPCPDCGGALHHDTSSATDAPPLGGSLRFFCCATCGGSWILTVRH